MAEEVQEVPEVKQEKKSIKQVEEVEAPKEPAIKSTGSEPAEMVSAQEKPLPKEEPVKKSSEDVKPVKEAPKEPKNAMEGTENMVFVGKKSTSAYVLAVMTQFSKGTDKVTIKARGRAISRAVDVAEIVRNKPEINAEIEAINVSTEEVTTMDGKPLKVSAIEIVLKK